MNFKKQIYFLIKTDDYTLKPLSSRIFNYFLFILIILNVLAVLIESSITDADVLSFFKIFEMISVYIFTLEYICRLLTSDLLYKKGFKSYLIYFFTPMAIIDLLAIIPFYLPLLIVIDLRYLRLFRLFRILRVFKLERYFKALILIKKVIVNKKEELILTLFLTFTILIISSALLFYAESSHQPDKFDSIVSSLWWGVVTLTTVGYGDMYPITALGKVINSIFSFIGILLMALPTGIIAAGFYEEIKQKKHIKTKCPDCGCEFYVNKEEIDND